MTEQTAPQGSDPYAIVVRSYRGRTQDKAALIFQQDATSMSQQGYFPISQSWADGRAGCLRWLLLGLAALVFKPDGTLTVTYQRHA